MSKVINIDIYSDGWHLITEENAQEPPQTGPVPQPEQLIGVRAKAGDLFLGAIHDNLDAALAKQIGYVGARTIINKIGLHQTNEIRVMYKWEGDKVRRTPAKYSWWPEHYGQAWVDQYYLHMTARQAENINGTHFGWRDGRTEGQLYPHKHLVCGGQLFKSLGRWSEFYLVACQNLDEPPIYSDHLSAPHLWVKQGICGHSKTKVDGKFPSYYGKVHPKGGDFYIVNACPGGIGAVPYWEIREYPVCPFDAIVDGVQMRIVELCFRGSEILGLSDDGNWYFMLEQKYSNGNQDDFVVHCAAFGKTLPVSTVGYKQEE